MLGAIPGTASESSLNRRGAASSDSTSRRLQRSPTRSRAVARALGALGGPFNAGIGVMEGEGLAQWSWSIVDCKSQVTPAQRTSEAPADHVRSQRAQEAVVAV